MKKVGFLNKIEIKKKQVEGKPVLRIISNIGLVCCGLALIASFVTDGFGGLTFSMLASIAVILGARGQFGKKTDYGSITTEIEFEEESMKVIYYDVDRRDNRGKRKEIFMVPYHQIAQMEFSENLQCIRITTTDELPFEVEWANSSMPQKAGNFKFLFFYLLRESKDEVYQSLVQYTNRMISVVE